LFAVGYSNADGNTAKFAKGDAEDATEV